jgi:hypothetical protein
MKNSNSFFAFYAFLALCAMQTACTDPVITEPIEGTGNANIYIKGTWGSQPYLLYSKQPFRRNDSITLNEVLFFVSDVTLVGTEKTGVLTDIDLVSLAKNHQTLAGAQTGELVKGKNKIPAATYTTLRFGLGVSPNLNATQPSQYSSTHPLGDVGLYWSSLRYVFSRMGGFTYANGNLTGTSWFYHTGTDPMYKTVSVAIPSTTITADKTTDISINLDLKKIFINGTDTIGVLGGYESPNNATQFPILNDWTTRLAGAFK